MEREVRYCTIVEDGVRIAYCVMGEGSGLLVLPHLTESFSVLHYEERYDAHLRSLGEGAASCSSTGAGLSPQNRLRGMPGPGGTLGVRTLPERRRHADIPA